MKYAEIAYRKRMMIMCMRACSHTASEHDDDICRGEYVYEMMQMLSVPNGIYEMYIC